MVTVNIRKQGGAAIMTIPPDVLKLLNAEVSSSLDIEVANGAFTARPVSQKAGKRYTLVELLQGATPEAMEALNAETAWAREGEPVGRESA